MYSASDVCDTDWSRPSFMQKGNTLFLLRDIRQWSSDPADWNEWQYVGLASEFNLLDVNLKLAELHQQLGLMSEAMAYFQIVANHYDKAGDVPRALTRDAILEAGKILGQAYREAGLPYNHYFAAPACWHYRAFIMITSLPVRSSGL